MLRRGYKTGPTSRDCGEADHTVRRCPVRTLLANPCGQKDLAELNNIAKDCVKNGKLSYNQQASKTRKDEDEEEEEEEGVTFSSEEQKEDFFFPDGNLIPTFCSRSRSLAFTARHVEE